MSKIKKIIKKYIQPSVIVIVFICIFIYLFRNYSKVIEICTAIQIEWLPIVIFSLIIINIYRSLLWAFIMKKMKCQLSYLHLVAIWNYSAIGTYIPGSVWMMVGRVYQLKEAGFSIKKATYGVGLEQIYSLATPLFVVAITPEIASQFNISWPINGLLLMLSIIVLFPNFWRDILWKFKIRIFDFQLIPKISFYNLLIYYIGLVLSFYVAGIEILFRLQLFNISSNSINIFNASAMPAAAFIIGYLTIIAPGGIGVKEGVLAYLLSNHMPLDTAIILAFSGRFWLLISHIFSVGVSYLYLRQKFSVKQQRA